MSSYPDKTISKAGPLGRDDFSRPATFFNGHSRSLAAAHPSSRLLELVIDHLSFGLIVVDARGKVLAANRTAQEILQTRDALIERNGVLQALRQHDNKRFCHSVAEAVAAPSNRPWNGGCIRLSRQSQKSAYILTVAPLSESVDLRSMGGGHAALIVITDPDRKHPTGLGQALQQAFGLTPAEARTASLIGAGLAPQDVADQLGITTGTIRSELKSIFAKIGISRQSELATIVARTALLIPEDRAL
jgi:DNA-binding CsgD family transcriptional regulator